MASLYLFDIEKLKSEFQGILQTYHEIIKKRKTLASKLAELKTTYQDLVKHNTKKIFLFCLDSFYFQYKTLILEMDHLSRSVASINNRMYGDYYKLYHIILVQLSESNHDMKSIETDHNKYTPYKDLEPFHEYKMADIISIHADILKLMNYLYTHFIKKSQTIVDYNNTARGGISITSFLHTLEYENTLIREQIGLYTSYIGFFHASQKKFLSKLFSKIQEFHTEIEDDILANHQHRQNAGIDSKQLEEFYTLAEEDPTEIELLLCETENLLDMDDEFVDKPSIQNFEEESLDAVSGSFTEVLFSQNVGDNVQDASSLDETKQPSKSESETENIVVVLDDDVKGIAIPVDTNTATATKTEPETTADINPTTDIDTDTDKDANTINESNE